MSESEKVSGVLSMAGFGDRPVSRLGLKCGSCDTRLVFTVHPTPRFAHRIDC